MEHLNRYLKSCVGHHRAGKIEKAIVRVAKTLGTLTPVVKSVRYCK